MTEQDVLLSRHVHADRLARQDRRSHRLYATAWSLDLAVLIACAVAVLGR